MLPDDCSISAEQLVGVREAALLALREGGGMGVFPTPVDEIMRAAKIEIVPIAIDEGYLIRLRRKAERAGKALVTAISKVLGIYDPHARIAFIDPETPDAKLPFLKLHEGGHAMLPWQSIFGLFEDCRMTLDPFVKAQFEREANVFASEVLFQLDQFSHDAASLPFGMKAPLQLAKRYGGSVYATARRYVTSSEKTCAVMIFNPPVMGEDGRDSSDLRRVVTSPSFAIKFPSVTWPARVVEGDRLNRIIPINRMTRPHTIQLYDANNEPQEFLAESFKGKHQTLVLIHAVQSLRRTIILPAAQSLSLF